VRPRSLQWSYGVDATNLNDQRMDEFAQRTEENFREVRGELRTEVQGLRAEMNDRFGRLEEKFDRRFDILLGALATGFSGVVVIHFLG
jgi:hypothetical protein